MSVTRKVAALAAVAMVAGVAGCGNRTDQGVVFKSLTKGLLQKQDTQGAMTPEQTTAAIGASLQSTDLPLALGIVEDRQATAVLANIENNGPYRTWGTADRRTITTRDGIVTATRGLGNDIMSSSVGGVAPLITGRQPGTGTHVLRFLDGENQTYEVRATCEISRGGQKQVSGGMLNNVPATEMTEACTADGQRFSNSYLVDKSGRVVQSRQWLGANGYMVIQILR